MKQPRLLLGILLAILMLALSAAITIARHSHVADEPTLEHDASVAGAWYCPMHTHVTSDHEGRCPICGMDLVQRKPEAQPTQTDAFYVDPTVQTRTGVVVETVQASMFRPAVRVAAQVVADERRAINLSPKVEGWIERLEVSVVGQPVRKGQVLYEIYSPELQQRQQDYLAILTRRDSLLAARGGAMGVPVGNTTPDLMLASVARERYRLRTRLLAADVPATVLESLEKYRRIHDVVPVLAEHDGVITSINAREGSYVRPGEPVLSYTDRQAAWVEVSMNPELLAQLQHGDEVELRSTVDSTAVITAPLNTDLAVIDGSSRTARIRFPISAKGSSFLPGTLLDAHIRMKARHAVTVQSDTVLRTGQGDFVIVAAENNHFRQAWVRLGAESEGRVEVLEGLSEGDKVVTNGQFLLSAESSLQSSWRRLTASHAPESSPNEMASHMGMHGGGHDHSGH